MGKQCVNAIWSWSQPGCNVAGGKNMRAKYRKLPKVEEMALTMGVPEAELAALSPAGRRCRWHTHLGLCLFCNNKPAEGSKMCQRHVDGRKKQFETDPERARATVRRFRANKRAAGLCVRCLLPVEPGKTMCRTHLDAACADGKARYALVKKRK